MMKPARKIILRCACWLTVPVWCVACQMETSSESGLTPDMPSAFNNEEDLSRSHEDTGALYDMGSAELPDAFIAPLDQDVPDQESPDLEELADMLSEDLSTISYPWGEAMEQVPGDPSWGDDGIWMGTGKEDLEHVVQGSLTYWEAGPQGGYHIWVGCELGDDLIGHLSDEELAVLPILYRIWLHDGTLLASTQRLGGLLRGVDERQVSVGQYAVLEAPIRPRRMDGEQLFYRVDVSLPDEQQPRTRTVWLTSQCCD